ncbi:hypothetical protein [Luteimonas sp. 3794]|uniref:hypothetical protein n=1 Tax=Luteimonas sp. 3794 TaxID=2817730 RepID=UPI00285D747A|nr:hypothetical protein [Luteimonas sp. 3794]MDR6992042.1 hypothetical protein [Luteimonas sp. 3794]
MSHNRTTSEPPTRPDQNPGYSEKNPNDKGDAQQPADTGERNPDEGGLDREPESMPDD